jgi:hypothetical protein
MQDKRVRMKYLGLLAAALVLSGLVTTLCAHGQPARHALLIGISDYSTSGLHDLPGAREDIRLMREIVRERLGIPETHLHVLLDAQATHQGIARAFAQLAERVTPGDFVYIHYSGHGSFLPDANDDEWRGGHDQTWVTFGARRPPAPETPVAAEAANLDRFDILDDELNQWLAPIAARAGELVYVADACHSATNTRGTEAAVIRAAPPATVGEHPLSRVRFQPHPLENAVVIAAARDDQSAHETTDAQGRSYGVFTWHWASALRQADPDATWRQLFERARLGVSRTYGQAQHPQLSGVSADRPMAGGQASPRRASVLVRDVDRERNRITLDAGTLSGVTLDSRYSRANPPAHVRIVETQATWSRAQIEEGMLEPGDFLVETEHAYRIGPTRLFVLRPTFDADRAHQAALRRDIEERMPGFERIEHQRQADLVLALLRPRRDQAGHEHYPIDPQGRRASLPEEDPEAALELWVLTPGEQLLHEHLKLPLAEPAPDFTALRRNLERYRRVREIQRLAEEAAGPANSVRIEWIAYERCMEPQMGCYGSSEDSYRPTEARPLATLDERRFQPADLVSFVLTNDSRRDHFVYVLNMAPDGQIRVLFPAQDMVADQARLRGGERLDLHREDIALQLDQPGEEQLLVLTSGQPINPYLLEQDGYDPTRAVGNPLEQLLTEAVHAERTRGSVTRLASDSWGLSMVRFEVQAPN